MQVTFRHQTPIQIRFKDIDRQGHVNNATYLSYFETARIAYFRDIIGGNPDWKSQGLILARIEVDYKVPVLLDDKVVVLSRVSRIGSKSFDINAKLLRSENGKEVNCCESRSVIVCFDYYKNCSIGIPEEWKQLILNFDGNYNS